MTANFLHLISSKPCSMSVNGKYLGTIDNLNDFEFDMICNTNRVFLDYNPISENNEYLPYTAMIECSSGVSTQNKNVKIIPFANNHTDILFEPYKYYSCNGSTLIFSKNIGKFYVSITNDNNSIINIFGSASLLLNKSINQITSANVDLKKDILIIEGIVSNDEYYILLFDTAKAEIIFEDIVHSISNKNNEIEILKNLKDISHHSLVCKVDFDSKTSQKYYVYENNICTYSTSEELIPMDFLQCLKIGDESKAKTILHNNLVNTDFTYFKNYFGDFDSIYLNRHEFIKNKLNYTLIGTKTKNYNFIMEDNKIIDIEDIF